MPFLWAKQMVEIQTAHQTSMALGMADHTSLGKPPQSTESTQVTGQEKPLMQPLQTGNSKHKPT